MSREVDPPDPFGPEETTNTAYADRRNFYKVEQWTANDQHIEQLLYAGNRIEREREIFDGAIARRPGGRYTIRQRARIVSQWPEV